MKQITSSEEFGVLIHSMRKSQKITQKKLAAYSGVGIHFIIGCSKICKKNANFC